MKAFILCRIDGRWLLEVAEAGIVRGPEAFLHRIVRKALRVVAVSIIMQSFAMTAQPSLERFKELVSSPPIVEEIYAERHYNGSKPTDYYFGRWQSNAFLLSVLAYPEKIEVGGGPRDRTQVCSRFGETLWTVRGENRSLKIGNVSSLSSSNELVLSAYWRAMELGSLLNCGIAHSEPGQIQWAGNTYIVTNHPGPSHPSTVVVSGQARTNLSGVVTGLTMDISIWPESPIRKETEPRKHHWEIEYKYDNSISELYPTVIKRYVLRPEDILAAYPVLSYVPGMKTFLARAMSWRTANRFLRDEIHIHSIKIAKDPLPPTSFGHQPFISINSLIFDGTNDGFYYIDNEGRRCALRRAPELNGPLISIEFWT